MKGKIKGKIMILPYLKDEIHLLHDETVYLKKESLIVFEEGDVYIDLKTSYVKEYGLLDGYVLPVHISGNTISIDMGSLEFIYFKVPEHVKEALHEDAVLCGNSSFSIVHTLKDIFENYSLNLLFTKYMNNLSEVFENEENLKLLLKVMEEKIKHETVTTIFSCQQRAQKTLDIFVGSFTQEMDDISLLYKEKLIQILQLFKRHLPTGPILKKRLMEERENAKKIAAPPPLTKEEILEQIKELKAKKKAIDSNPEIEEKELIEAASLRDQIESLENKLQNMKLQNN